MSRRHLFDNGYPVTCATLVAGAEVLLAVSRQALRSSRARLGRSLLRLADTSLRLRDSRENCSRLLNHAERARNPQSVEAGAGHQPGKGAARQAPHRA